MKKSSVLAVLSLGSFMAVLFNPAGKNYWIYFLILGIVFGVLWFMNRD